MMGSEQQFCLRWNNHQSTLVSVFDVLLENETLVDVTLAAEGQFLRAHKVVLSACSPYFHDLLSHHSDKHPIVILKDVRFEELRALVDYMYRGEVNVSQDQLSVLIKTAESLKIKGLADGNDKRQEKRSVAPCLPSATPATPVAPAVPLPLVPAPVPTAPPPPPPPPPSSQVSSRPTPVHMLSEQISDVLIQDTVADRSDGSLSPRPKRQKRRRSGDSTDHGSEGRNTPVDSSVSLPNIPAIITPVSGQPLKSASETTSDIEERTAKDTETDNNGLQTPLVEPKVEVQDEKPENPPIEEISLEEEDDLSTDVMPGPSQAGPSGEGSASTHGFLDELYSVVARHAPYVPYEATTFGRASLQGSVIVESSVGSSLWTEGRKTTEAALTILLESLDSCEMKKYSLDSVKRALTAIVKEHMSVTNASRMYGIKRTTLQYYLKKMKEVFIGKQKY